MHYYDKHRRTTLRKVTVSAERSLITYVKFECRCIMHIIALNLNAQPASAVSPESSSTPNFVNANSESSEAETVPLRRLVDRLSDNTIKPVLSGHSKIDKTKITPWKLLFY